MSSAHPTPPLGLYVHIPFCETKCPYCDFNTYGGIEALIPAYMEALARETKQWGAALARPHVTTVFFGGGTPSHLPPEALARLMETVGRAFTVAPEAEVTLEANPGDVTASRLHAWRTAEFNRISIGVQSLDDAALRLLGRRHTAGQARAAVAAARQAGFDNLSLDLMFGLPHHPLEVWERTLEEALALAPDHLSLYCLTLEPGTPMEAEVRAGRLPDPDADLAAEMYEHAGRRLAAEGYEQYEISNWARPGHASRHNLIYWRNECYLGLGPGAHSCLRPSHSPPNHQGWRFANVKSPRTYIRRVRDSSAASAVASWDAAALRKAGAVEMVETIDVATAMAETMMLGLRLNKGVSDAEFSQRFDCSIEKRFPNAVAECIDLGLLVWEEGRLRLTDHGRLLGNEAFQRFVAPAAKERAASATSPSR